MGFKCLIMGYDISDTACDNCSLDCEFSKRKTSWRNMPKDNYGLCSHCGKYGCTCYEDYDKTIENEAEEWRNHIARNVEYY